MARKASPGYGMPTLQRCNTAKEIASHIEDLQRLHKQQLRRESGQIVSSTASNSTEDSSCGERRVQTFETGLATETPQAVALSFLTSHESRMEDEEFGI